MMGIYDVSMSRMLEGFNYEDLIEGLVKDDGMLGNREWVFRT